MTDLFNLQTAEYAAVALLLTGLILQSIAIYIYRQHSKKLSKALENNTRNRQAERKLQAEKIRAPARIFLLIFIFIPISIINDNQSVNCFMQRY